MQVGGGSNPCMNGIVPSVRATMQNIGCAVQIARWSVPMSNIFGDPERDLCSKCGRWFNTKSQHICIFDDLPDKMNERAKLIRWLKKRGEYETEE